GPGSAALLPGAHGNQAAGDHLQPAAGCQPRPVGHLVGFHRREGAPRRIVPLGLAQGVHGLRRHGHDRRGGHLYGNRVSGRECHLRASRCVEVVHGHCSRGPFRSKDLVRPGAGHDGGRADRLTASSRTNGKDSPTGLAVSYTSRNQRVCTVSGATVVPWTGGRCVIIASQDGNAQYLPAKPVGQEFPVARAAQTVTFTPPASATIGQPITLTATTSSWLPVTYTSSTPGVCTVSGATLTPTAAGPRTVVASQPGAAQYAPA